MKILLSLILSFFMFNIANANDIYSYNFKGAEKGEIKLEDYKDHTVLFVNIATRCGYTGQLDGLEKLYQKYKDKKFVVVGLPSNDFGQQTPEENKEVAKFCRLKYGVSFPITEKLSVTGDQKHPLVGLLLKSTSTAKVSWNFNKFLLNKKGKVVAHFPSSVAPEDKNLIQKIEEEI